MARRQAASKASALESSAGKPPTAGSLLGPPQILPLVERFFEGLHRPVRKNLVLLVKCLRHPDRRVTFGLWRPDPGLGGPRLASRYFL